MNMSPGTGGGGAAIGMSNVGFLLSFIDDASPHLKRVASAYRQLTSAMDEAYKKANQTGLFTNGLERIIRGMEKYVEIGHQAVGLMASFSQLSKGKFGKVEVDVKLRRLPRLVPLAKGGIVTRPTNALLGEAGAEAVIPLSGFMKGFKGGMKGARESFSGMKEKSAKATEKMLLQWGKNSDSWSKSFGKEGSKSIRDVSKGLKDSGDAIERIDAKVSAIGITQALRDVQGKFGGIEDSQKSFLEKTKEMGLTLGMSRKETVDLRNELRSTFKGAKYDVDAYTASFQQFFEAGLSKDTSKKLAETGAVLQRLTGVDATESMMGMAYSFQMSDDAIQSFALNLKSATESSKLAKAGLGNIPFKAMNDDVKTLLPNLYDFSRTFSDKEKKNAVNTIAAISGGMYDAGLSAEDFNSILSASMAGDFEGNRALERAGLGIGTMTENLKNNRPDLIMKNMMSWAGGLDEASLSTLRAQGVISERTGQSVENLKHMAAKGKQALSSTEKMAKLISEQNTNIDEQKKKIPEVVGFFDDLAQSVKNFTAANPILGVIADNVENLGPALMGVYFATDLLDKVGLKPFTKLGGVFGKMGKAGKVLGKTGGIKLESAIEGAGKAASKSTKSVGILSKGFSALAGTELLALGPILIIVALLAAAAVGIMHLWKTSLPFRIMIEQMKISFEELINSVAKFLGFNVKLGDSFKWLGDSLMSVADFLGQVLVGALSTVLEIVKAVVGAIMTVVQVVKGLASFARAFFGKKGNIFDKLGAGFGAYGQGFADIWSGPSGMYSGKQVDIQAVNEGMAGKGNVAVMDAKGKTVIVNMDNSETNKKLDMLNKINKDMLVDQKKSNRGKGGGGGQRGYVPSMAVALW